MEFEAARIRRREDIQRDVTLAWSIAALERQKKLPELKSLLTSHERGQSSGPTPGQMRTELSMLSDYLGIPLRKRKKKKKKA